jgi:hypothetical protein
MPAQLLARLEKARRRVPSLEAPLMALDAEPGKTKLTKVHFGSKAVSTALKLDVCFTSESGPRQRLISIGQLNG